MLAVIIFVASEINFDQPRSQENPERLFMFIGSLPPIPVKFPGSWRSCLEKLPADLPLNERRQRVCYLNSCRSRFSTVYLVFEMFQDTGTPIRKILVYPGMLPCLVP